MTIKRRLFGLFCYRYEGEYFVEICGFRIAEFAQEFADLRFGGLLINRFILGNRLGGGGVQHFSTVSLLHSSFLSKEAASATTR